MNKVVLMGRLTRDPNVKYTQSNEPIAVARFSLAVNRKTKKKIHKNTQKIKGVEEWLRKREDLN